MIKHWISYVFLSRISLSIRLNPEWALIHIKAGNLWYERKWGNISLTSFISSGKHITEDLASPKSYCLCILCLQFLHLSFLIPVTSLWSESALLCLVCIKESIDALLRRLSPLLQNKSTQDNIKYLYYRTWTSTTCCPISIFKDYLRWPQTITTRYHGVFKI